MPLIDGGLSLIRGNLEALQQGKRVPLVVVGRLTQAQLDAINEKRASHQYPPIEPELVFVGQHIYNSRIVRDGYTINDVTDQISSAIDSTAMVLDTSPMTTMENTRRRRDRYGNCVLDRIVLECSTRHPRSEIFSVIPKGDRNKPKKKAAHEDERP